MKKQNLVIILAFLVFALAGPFAVIFQQAQEGQDGDPQPAESIMVETVCAGSAVPAGWVIVNITYESYRCGVMNQPIPPAYNVWWIKNVSGSQNGSEELVCRTSANNGNTPPGWTVVTTYAESWVCGVGAQPIPVPAYNVQLIRRLTGGPTPTPNTPTPTPNPTPRGNFDLLNDGTAIGWAFDPDSPSTNVTLHFYVDGPAGQGQRINAQPTTYIPRPDVNATFGVTGNHGFAYALPRQYYDGQNHTLYVYALNVPASNNNALLHGSPKTFNLKSGSPMGKFETVGNDRILRGWSLDPSNPNASNTVHFYLNGVAGQGTPIGAALANVVRPDVNTITGLPGNHGFEFSIPAQYQNGQNQTVYAYGLDLNGDPNTLLTDSPKVFNFPPIVNVSRTAYDYNGDGKADQSVFRNGSWFENISPSGTLYAANFGWSSDTRVPADYDGDGKTDIAIFRNNNGTGEWWILKSSNNQVISAAYGYGTDTPAPADYDGDGKADLAVFRNSNNTGYWYILRSSDNQAISAQFGYGTDIPVAADYDGDGKADIAVNRISGNSLIWFLQQSTAGYYGIQFGLASDITVPADYDGDRKADLAVFRNGEWYINRSRDGAISFSFGMAGDMPVPSDYDGDSKTDIAIFRNNNGIGDWWISRSSDSQYYVVPFGYGTDLPLNGQ